MVPDSVDPHHPVLAGEDLLKVVQLDAQLADDGLPHPVIPALSGGDLGLVGEAAERGRSASVLSDSSDCIRPTR